MERLCGPVSVGTVDMQRTVYLLSSQDSLHVVYRRFSQGVDVVKCVLGFIKVASSSTLAGSIHWEYIFVISN